MDGALPPLVGREHERRVLGDLLDALRGGAGAVLLVEGEPGIGKSRLLAELRRQAGGCTVLAARASEYEADLPYALWEQALGLDLSRAGADGRVGVHRTVRDALERPASEDPVVLCLDDVHWADPGSAQALAALVHRPPAAPVLIAVAARTRRLPRPLDAALGGVAVTRLAPAPLDPAAARELVGAAADAVFAASGGNPFYLEQLARAAPGTGVVQGDDAVPPAVAASLTAELAALPAGARALLDGAAIAGDPFELGLAAAVAELGDREGLEALDVLLGHGLLKPGEAPRRFAFRHPVVRHGVLEAAPAGWRIGAHARAAAALERRGAGAVAQAHHVERSASPGDERAIAALDAAAQELQSLAPATAARFLAALDGLLPGGPRRTGARLRLADAQAAAGDAAGARATLLAAMDDAESGDRLRITIGIANAEWRLGRTADARRRLHVALGALPAEPSPDRVRLRLALALTALMEVDPVESAGQASDAADDARAIGDRVFEAAALACGALAAVEAGDRASGTAAVGTAAAALDRLTSRELATRLPAFGMLGRARRALGQLEPALADLDRGAAIAAETGRETILLQLSLERAVTLVALGRIRDAVAAAEQGLELAELSGNDRMLLWAHATASRAQLAAGAVMAALEHAERAAAAGAQPDLQAAGEPGWCLGNASTAAGNPGRAVEAMLASFGGPGLDALPPAARAEAAADLAAAQLAAGDAEGAGRTLAGREPDTAPLLLARSALLLARGRADEALEVALAARAATAGAPLAAARAELAVGRAHAAAGRRDEALAALTAAEARLDACGAVRLRDEAVRELRRLGHRVRRGGGARTDGGLTAREREIALLVASGRTNREIAEQLVLSTRTIEAHLRTIYGKLGLRSRVELTRALADEEG